MLGTIGIASLVGDFYVKYCVVKAGVYLPLVGPLGVSLAVCLDQRLDPARFERTTRRCHESQREPGAEILVWGWPGGSAENPGGGRGVDCLGGAVRLAARRLSEATAGSW